MGRKPGRNKAQLTLSVNPLKVEKLLEICIRYKCYWGVKPSISKLVDYIVEGKLLVVKPEDVIEKPKPKKPKPKRLFPRFLKKIERKKEMDVYAQYR